MDTEAIRRAIVATMERYHRAMINSQNALDARRDESDHSLNAKLEIDIAMHQTAWCALLSLAGDLKIKLDVEQVND